MSQDKITVAASVNAAPAKVWAAYTSPDHIRNWNFASEDWCCPRATADLREGGAFSYRMEAKDGSMGFDFEGVFTRIQPEERIEYAFGDRHALVTFTPISGGVLVEVSFDPENDYPPEQQRDGWQSILDNFAAYAATL